MGLSASQDASRKGPAPSATREAPAEGAAVPPTVNGGPTAPPPAPTPGGSLRPHVPTDLQGASIGGSFYANAFAFRTWMRESPQRLVAERRLAERPALVMGPLRAWSAPAERLPPVAPASEGTPGEERSVVGSAPPHAASLTPSQGELPTLRPEAPLRSLRFAALENARRSGTSDPANPAV